MSEAELKTPCIGVCSTVFGDPVCRGCKRFFFEVTNWNGYSHEERRAIWRRLRRLRELVLQRMLVITNPKALRQHIATEGIFALPDPTDLEIAYSLLCRKASTMEHTSAYGFKARDAKFSGSLVDLLRQTEAAFLELSQAHYQRYFAATQ